MRIVIVRDSGYAWLRIVAGNGEICFTSEGYRRWSKARTMAKRYAKRFNLPVVDKTRKE